MVRLGDLFEFKNGRSFKKTEWKQTGLPIIRIQNLNNEDAPFNYFDDEYDSSIEVNSGDLLFSWSGTVGSSFGPHIWYREKGVLNQHIFKLTFKRKMEKRYAFYSLLFITAEIERSVVGAVGLVHVTKKSLNEFQIPLPPIPEQQRIVAILDQAFADIEKAHANAERNLKNARELFDSYLNQVFSQRGEKNQVVMGWAKYGLEQLVEDDSPITYGVVKPGKAGDVLFIRGGDLAFGEVRLGNLRTITTEVSQQYKRTILRGGELLVSLVGTPGQIGIVPQELKGANIARQVGLIRLRPDNDKRFISYFLQSPPGLDALGAEISGAVQKVINLNALRTVEIPLPPIPEQQRIVASLDKISKEVQQLEKRYQEKLVLLEELKKSLLQKAFSGELTKTEGHAA
jgi:type I restriction enzyme S subunit